MASVSYTCVSGYESFSTTGEDGELILVEAGKTYATSDEKVQAALDAAPHAVKRSKKGEE